MCMGICILPQIFCICAVVAWLGVVCNPFSPLFWIFTVPTLAALGVTSALVIVIRGAVPWGLPLCILSAIALEISIWLGKSHVMAPAIARMLDRAASFNSW